MLKLFRFLLFLSILGIVSALLILVSVTALYAPQIHSSVDAVPAAYSALVLGAGVRGDGSPSSILKDRVERGVELYKAGKVKKLIMSGDNRFAHYNEPDVMVKLAIDQGIPQGDVYADYAGRRTYDSCWRAKNIFSQGNIIVVTQSFHMTRAIFLCEHMGIQTQGVTADISPYAARQWVWWSFRDMISLFKSIVDVFIWHPKVIGGEKIVL